MKIKEGFVLRSIAGSNVVVPIGERAADLNGMITLNDTGAFIWKCLEEETDIDQVVEAVLDCYEVDEERANRCVIAFIEKLKEVGCLDD